MEPLAIIIILVLAAGVVAFGGESKLVQKAAQVGGIAWLIWAVLTLIRFLLK